MGRKLGRMEERAEMTEMDEFAVLHFVRSSFERPSFKAKPQKKKKRESRKKRTRENEGENGKKRDGWESQGERPSSRKDTRHISRDYNAL